MKQYAYMAAITYSLIIGLSFLFVKETLSFASPFTILGHRFLIAFIVILAIVIVGKKVMGIKREHLLMFIGISMIYPVLFFTFQVFSLTYISSSEAGIFQAVSPAFTLLLAAVFLKERASTLQIIGINLSIGGVLFIMFSDLNGAVSGNFIGSLLILLCSLSTALYQVLARKLTVHYTPLQITFWMTLFGFVVFNIVSIVHLAAHGQLSTYIKTFQSQSYVLSILYLSVLSSLATSFLSNYTLSKLSAVQMSIFGNLATLVTIVAGILLLHETLYFYHFVGVVLVISGILFVNLFKIKGERHEKQH